MQSNRKKILIPFPRDAIAYLLITVIVLLAYYPAFKMNLRLLDDHTNLHRAGTLPVGQYMLEAIDPRLQSIAYRPVGLVLLWIEYHLFGGDAVGYHLTQVLLHLANALLVFQIVTRFTSWHAAILAAMMFAGFPVASEAVFWVSEQTPIATLFSLCAVLFWVQYLQSKNQFKHRVALVLLTFALLSRESAVVIPVVFVLADLVVLGRPQHLIDWMNRYITVALITSIYLGIEYGIQLRGLHVEVGRFSLGTHILANYAEYLAMLLLPWITKRSPNSWLFGILLIVSLSSVVLLKRSIGTVVLILLIFITLSPVVMLGIGITPRYLYMTTIPWSIFLALAFEHALTITPAQIWRVSVACVFTCFLIANSFNTVVVGTAMAETIRQSRVPFRDVMRDNPSLPTNTRLFFVEPPHNTVITEIAGMFFLRYGKHVSVSGTFQDDRPFTYGRLSAEHARLRDYPNAKVYFFDEENKPILVPVAREDTSRANLVLPATFEVPIRLEGYELSSANVQLGQPIAVILYWRATGQIDRDYTVFVHLIDSNGQILTGVDSKPRLGKENTSRWKTGQLTTDAHLVTLPSDLARGTIYRLEVGLYDLETMRSLALVDEQGISIGNTITIDLSRTNN